MLEDFPGKPKGMHWWDLRAMVSVHDVAEERLSIGLMPQCATRGITPASASGQARR